MDIPLIIFTEKYHTASECLLETRKTYINNIWFERYLHYLICCLVGRWLASGLGGLVSVLVSDEGHLDVLTVRGYVLVAAPDQESLLVSVVLVLACFLSGCSVTGFESGNKFVC